MINLFFFYSGELEKLKIERDLDKRMKELTKKISEELRIPEENLAKKDIGALYKWLKHVPTGNLSPYKLKDAKKAAYHLKSVRNIIYHSPGFAEIHLSSDKQRNVSKHLRRFKFIIRKLKL